MSCSPSKSAERIFYVYAYLDPTVPVKLKAGRFRFSTEPFYVGYGHGKRSHSHLSAALRGSEDKRNLHKHRRIVKLLEGTESGPTVSVLQSGLTETEAKLLENNLILSLGRRNLKTGCLTNKTDGGEGQSGLVHSKKTKSRISASGRKFWSEADEGRHHQHGLKIKEGHRIRHATISVEERERERAARSSARSLVYSSMTAKEKEADRIRRLGVWERKLSAMTPEEREVRSRNLTDGQHRRHLNLTDEQKAAKAEAYRKKGLRHRMSTELRKGTLTAERKRFYTTELEKNK